MRADNQIGDVGVLANALQVNKSLHTLHLRGEWMGRGSGWGACSERGREGGREVRRCSSPMTGRQGSGSRVTGVARWAGEGPGSFGRTGAWVREVGGRRGCR